MSSTQAPHPQMLRTPRTQRRHRVRPWECSKWPLEQAHLGASLRSQTGRSAGLSSPRPPGTSSCLAPPRPRCLLSAWGCQPQAGHSSQGEDPPLGRQAASKGQDRAQALSPGLLGLQPTHLQRTAGRHTVYIISKRDEARSLCQTLLNESIKTTLRNHSPVWPVILHFLAYVQLQQRRASPLCLQRPWPCPAPHPDWESPAFRAEHACLPAWLSALCTEPTAGPLLGTFPSWPR